MGDDGGSKNFDFSELGAHQRLVEMKDYEDFVDQDVNAIAYRERKWAVDNVWPDYLGDVSVPLKRRVRTSICLSLRIPPSMKKELDGKGTFNKTGRIEKLDLKDISFRGIFDPYLYQKKQPAKKRKKR